MRCWHYKLIPYLPKSQLLAQWRELNSIFKKQDKHILINYIYEYPKNDLKTYSCMVIDEMHKRGIKINSMDNFKAYFGDELLPSPIDNKLFKNHHNYDYLRICYFNLYEKYLRGQKDFDEECWEKLNDFMINEEW